MKSKQWEIEIDKLSKDELTVFLAGFENVCKFEAFKREFQLGYFYWMIPYIKDRIEFLAKRDEEMELGIYEYDV